MTVQRNWQEEFDGRVAWIRGLVESAGVKGIVFGNSGGKDSALAGILCKAACENTVGIIMPCDSDLLIVPYISSGALTCNHLPLYYSTTKKGNQDRNEP